MSGRPPEHSPRPATHLCRFSDSAGERPPRCAELSRYPTRRLDHCCRQPTRSTARKHAIGVSDNRDGADGIARSVEDRCGDAGLPEHRFVTLGRDRRDANGVQLDAQRRGVRRSLRQSFQRRRHQVVDQSPGAKASSALPRALACNGSCEPTSRICKVASGRNTWWTTTALGPCITPTRTENFVRTASCPA